MSSSERVGSEEVEVRQLMNEGFGDPLPRRAGGEIVAVERSAEAPAASSRPSRPLGFALGNCRLSQSQADALVKKYNIDRDTYRVFVTPEAGEMSSRCIPLPLAHFEAGLRLPMDPAFGDFLVFARVQPGRIHPNSVRVLFALICLCRRLGCEFSVVKLLRLLSF